jgi:hypothetical protein
MARPTATVPTTAAANSSVSRSIVSPLIGAANATMTNGCKSSTPWIFSPWASAASPVWQTPTAPMRHLLRITSSPSLKETELRTFKSLMERKTVPSTSFGRPTRSSLCCFLNPDKRFSLRTISSSCLAEKKIRNALDALWERPIRKRDVQGIHGTLFYKLEHHKQFYRQKREDGVLAYCVNVAQRRLFGLSEKDRALSSTTGVSSSSRSSARRPRRTKTPRTSTGRRRRKR